MQNERWWLLAISLTDALVNFKPQSITHIFPLCRCSFFPTQRSMKQICTWHCGSISIHTEEIVCSSGLFRGYDPLKEEKGKTHKQISPSLILKGEHNPNIIKNKAFRTIFFLQLILCIFFSVVAFIRVKNSLSSTVYQDCKKQRWLLLKDAEQVPEGQSPTLT